MTVLPSGEISHFSARAGSISVPPDVYLTRPSYIAVSAMKPSWAVIAGGSRRSVSLPHRNVSVLAAVAGLTAGAVVGAAAGAVVGAAAGAVVGLGAAVGAAGAVVGAAAGAAGPQAARSPIPAATPPRLRKRRRVSSEERIVRSPLGA